MTNKELLKENAFLKQKIQELEHSESERKHAEEALRRSEENFRHSLDDSPMGVRIVTIEGGTIYANRAILDIYGYDSVEELKTTPVKNRYTPQSYAEFKIRREKRKGDVDVPSEYAIGIIRKNGEIRHLHVFRKDVLWDGERQFQVIYQDITERKRAEVALRESEERLRTIVEASLDAIIAVNVEGRLVLFNGAAQELFQYSEEEALNQPADILLREEICEIHQERLERFLKKGVGRCGHIGRRMEKPFRRKDGSLFEAEVSMSGGRLNGLRLVVLAIHDITDRKKAEEALRESEMNYKDLVENANSIIIKMDQNGILTFVNDYAQKFFGYTWNEIIEKDMKILVPPTESSGRNLKEMVDNILRDPDDYIENINENIRKNGEHVWISWRNKGIRDSNGNIVGNLAIGHDITERKRAEDALREKSHLNKTLLDAFPCVALLLRPQTREIISSNTAAVKVGALPGTHCFSTWGQRQDPCPWCLAPALWATGEAQHLEVEALGIFWDAYWIPVAEDLYMHFAFDITDRKRAEEALSLKQAQLQAILDYSPALISIKDLNGNVILANRNFAVLDVLPLHEFVGKNVFDLFPREVAEKLWNNDQLALKAGGPVESEEIVQHKDGGWHTYLTVKFPVYKEPGQPFGTCAISTDITERKRAEEQLKESEEIMRYIIKHDPNAIAVYDRNLRYIAVSNRYLQDYNIKEADIIGKHHYEVFPEMPQRWKDVHARCLAGATERNDDDYFERPDGSITYNRWECRPWYRSDGEIGGMITYTEVTTERKNAELALRRSEENFRNSLDDSPMGVRIVTEEGKTIYANRAVLDIYGYDSMEDLKTTPVAKRYTPESHADFLIRREKRQQGVDVPSEYTINIIRKDGEVRHLQVFRKEILWDGERQFQVIYQDITERKRAEEALKESEERYRQLFSNAPAGIYEIDLTTGRLLSVNDVICKYTGYTRDELLAINALDLLTGESQKIFMERMAGYAAGEPVPSILEYQARSKSGREFWMSLNARYFHKEGVPVRATVVAYDITERKRTEEELRTSSLQLRALAVRLQQIREYERIMIAREIHDEMGGGLTGLKMDLSWLSRKMGDADPCEERVALMDKIHKSNALIDQMIHVVRRISTDLRPSVLDDLGLIAALEWQLLEFTSRTEIQHEFIKTFDYVYLEEDTSVAVFRIFQEALTNVMRHSRATKVVVVLLEGERSLFGDESLVLEIRDNGRGITEEEILNKDSLGLLGMKERVLTFGGELSIRGEPGGGAALVLKIPRKRGEQS
jgi:PAS domain S-box-containing protein